MYFFLNHASHQLYYLNPSVSSTFSIVYPIQRYTLAFKIQKAILKVCTYNKLTLRCLGSHFQVPDVFEDMEAAAGKMQGWLSCPFSIRKFPCEYEDPSKTAQISSNHLLFTIFRWHFMNGFCYEMKQQTDLSKSQVIFKRHLLVYYLKNTLVYTNMASEIFLPYAGLISLNL